MPQRSALAFCLLLTGCSALEAAAPVAFAATEALIRSQLQDAPATHAVDLAATLALLEQCRAAKVAAEAAALRAEKAARDADNAATIAEEHSRAADASAKAARLEIQLAKSLLKVMGETPPAPVVP